MPCRPIYGPGRNVAGIVCTRGRRGKQIICQFCGNLGAELECDGPKSGGKTCDAKMCRMCAVGIRALDVDFCPPCSKQLPESCALGPTDEHHCAGPTVKQDRLCLSHCLLFTYWLRRCGGWESTYSKAELSQEDKRGVFRNWLSGFTRDDAKKLLAAYGLRNA